MENEERVANETKRVLDAIAAIHDEDVYYVMERVHAVYCKHCWGPARTRGFADLPIPCQCSNDE